MLDMDGKVAKYILLLATSTIVVWMAYKGFNLVKEDIPRFNAEYLVQQQDYGKYETDVFYISGVKFYYPVEGDRIGYDCFPSAPKNMEDQIDFMGYNIDSGFIAISDQ